MANICIEDERAGRVDTLIRQPETKTVTRYRRATDKQARSGVSREAAGHALTVFYSTHEAWIETEGDREKC
jgi:hypothetical protein